MRSSQEPGLITIERVVAFVLTPLVVAVSGTLSALAVKAGFAVTPGEIEAAFATGGLSAGAAAWKWLHGRQLSEEAKHQMSRLEHEVGPKGDDFIHTTLRDLEGLAQSAAQKAADAITAPDHGGGIEPVEPIPAAVDPAPSSGGQQAVPVQGQAAGQADTGAASGQ